MRKSFFGADNRSDLAADTLVQVPGHQVIARDHAAPDGHLVFVSCFLGNSALAHAFSIKYPQAAR